MVDEKALEAAARAVERHNKAPYGWSDDEFETWWSRDTRFNTKLDVIRCAKLAIATYLQALSPGEGWVLVPKEPTPELLHSMAVRYDHGLGVPGYYDQPVFGAENVGHAKRLESTIRTMRQLHEEVVGTGFHRAPSAMLSAAGER